MNRPQGTRTLSVRRQPPRTFWRGLALWADRALVRLGDRLRKWANRPER
jgi:hypothetical protein